MEKRRDEMGKSAEGREKKRDGAKWERRYEEGKRGDGEIGRRKGKGEGRREEKGNRENNETIKLVIKLLSDILALVVQ